MARIIIADDDPLIGELARFAGANDYLRKPFDLDELVFRAEQLLEGR